MANPTAEKLKVFGLRHGEKVAMGVVAVIFATCTYFAWSRPSIEITPEEVKSNADKASDKINARQNPVRIVEELEKQGVKEQAFEKKVDLLQAGVADASKYRLDRPFVSPEPGAGLIRDMPELLAPTQLYVHAGRGAIRVFVLDDDGNPKPKADDPKKGGARKSTKKSAGSGMAGLAGYGGGAGKKDRKSGTLAEAERKRDEELAERRKREGIAGADDVKEDAVDPAAAPQLTADEAETALQGQRFATLVGRFDHQKQKELYARALKVDPAGADPNYQRLEVERRERKSDNEWGAWTPINREKFGEVDGVLTEAEGEIVPADSRISTLIDRLPFLEVGYWVGAHHASLVPKALLQAKESAEIKAKETEKGKGMNRMGGGNMMGAADYQKKGMSGGAPGGGDYGAGMSGGGGFSPLNLEQSGRRGGGPADADFDKSQAEAIMVRALDYDVDPDAVYQYRVRIVVANPNLGWENVSPGVDNKVKELKGPWSLATAEVGIPADVATYAAGRAIGSDVAAEKFDFQVVAWNEQDGYTVLHKFDISPGQIIGSRVSVTLPDEARGEGTKSRPVDFTSRQILVDALGGDRPAAEIQPLGVPRLEVPMLALVVRADGVMVVRDQAQDAASGEMAEMKAIYDQLMKDAVGPKKENSTLGGAGGGLMGGGYGGGGISGAN